MTETNSIKIKLYGEQTRIWNAMLNSRKNVLAVVPVGSGKTFLASLLLPIAATTPTMHLDRSVVYVAPTYPMIDRIMWQPLKKVCIEHFGLKDEKDINNSKKTITFPGGQQIMCLSAETGLKGINAGLIICDEAAEFSEEALQELTNRIRPAVGDPTSTGRMICITTPEGKNAFHKMYEMALEHPEEWIVFHYNYEKMRVHSKSWIEKQRYILSPMKFDRDLRCHFGSVEDQFYYTWKESMAVNETVDRKGEIWIGSDFNKRVMCSVVGQLTRHQSDSTSKLEILKSYAIKDCGTEMLARTIRDDFPGRSISAVIDMSGSQVNRDTTSVFGVTDKTILEKYGIKVVNMRKGNPLIADTDNSANAFINQGRLAVPVSEIKLLESMSTYHYEDAERKKLVKYSEANLAHIDGLGDALRYLIHHLFPLRKEIPVSEPRRFGHSIDHR